MIVLSSLKQKRVHNNVQLKPKPANSSYIFSQTSFNSNQKKIKPIGKKALMLNQTPILSFTSFQSYLQDCNQNSFVKKQHQRLFRSQQKHKTQQNFNPKKHIYGSSQTKKQRFLTQQDNNQISPFQTDKQIVFSQYKSGKSNRKAYSKSQSSNYDFQKSSSFAQKFLHQKLGKIDGWNHNQEQQNALKNERASNQSILRQKSSENKEKNENNSKISTKKPKYQIQSPLNSLPKNVLNHSMRQKKFMSSSNKENFSQIQPVFILRKKKAKQSIENMSSPFHKTNKKSFNPINCLTQINQLEQEILLSKRQDITNRSIHALKSINYNEQSNILRLKKEAQYLCEQQDNYCHKDLSLYGNKQNIPVKSKSVSIQLGENSNNNNSKGFKPFMKFPQDQLRNINVDNQNLCNKTGESFEFKQKSTGVMKILQSKSPNNYQNTLYEPRTPIKPSSNLKNYSKITGTQSDMKNATRNRQIFHNSIKQRKSKSAFNSICRNEKVLTNKNILKINTSQFINTKNEEQDKLLITIVNSFHSVKNNKQKTNNNKNNLSLTKSINVSTNKQQNECKRLHTSVCFQQENDQFGMTSNCKDISEFLIDSHHENFPISFSKQKNIHHNLSLNDSLEPLQNLNKLSQEIKKMTKLSTPIYLSTKYNKKFSNFHKSIKNQKSSLRSSNFCKKDQDFQNLFISQLQGRQIHQLKKLSQIQK